MISIFVIQNHKWIKNILSTGKSNYKKNVWVVGYFIICHKLPPYFFIILKNTLVLYSWMSVLVQVPTRLHCYLQLLQSSPYSIFVPRTHCYLWTSSIQSGILPTNQLTVQFVNIFDSSQMFNCHSKHTSNLQLSAKAQSLACPQIQTYTQSIFRVISFTFLVVHQVLQLTHN